MRKTTDYHDFTTINTPQEERKRLNTGDIWINEAKCTKCGDTVRSRNLHDFRRCKCKAIAVDGGSFYARRAGDISAIEDNIVLFNDVVK